MRVLFVTYCFGDDSGQTLVGVYKRGLRVGLELHARGHEVLVDCTGRTTYRDDLTDAAEQRLRFVDLGLALGEDARDPEAARARAVAALRRADVDLVVVGEAPLAGTLVEAALAAAELDVPVAVLDNAYNDTAAREFLENHGRLVDGVVLTGPTCTHAPDPSPKLAQVAPLVSSDRRGAGRLLRTTGLSTGRLAVVLGYDARTELLGFSLLERLRDPEVGFVFVTRRSAEARRRAAGLPPDVEARVRILDLLSDELLFGVIELADLAVVKYGFMQVTESLALRTPVICAFHEGATWVDLLPEVCASFVHVCDGETADASTVEAATRFLRVDGDALRAIHDGAFDAVAEAADFLERLPEARRSDAWLPVDGHLPATEVHAAVRAILGQGASAPLVRSMRIRSSRALELHALVCRSSVDGRERVVRLWARRYRSPFLLVGAIVRAVLARRRLLAVSPRRGVLIEPDRGHALLPPL